MSPADPPAGPPPEEPTPPLDAQAIARELDRISRWVQKAAEEKGWTDELREMWKATRECFNGLTALAEASRPAPSGAWLLQVGEEPAALAERLTDLVKWLDEVFRRYPGTELPSCWLWHPSVIEELLWLRAYHAKAYGPHGDPVAQGMWHDQSLPRLLDRLRPQLSGCDLSKHVPAGQKAKPPLPVPLAGHVHLIAEAMSTTGLPPEPTEEQLADAAQYLEAKHQRNTSS